MKKVIRKILAGILAATCVISMSVPAMADDATPQVFVNFICGGNSTGQYVPAGSDVTAPAVPLVGGHTFCGFDKSLKNVTVNTTYTAIYMPDSAGEAAIAAKKASLPTPAVTATTVANPAAAPSVPAATAAPATAPAAAANTTGIDANALAALLQAQQAAVQTAKAAAPAAPAAETQPAPEQKPEAAPAAQAPAAQAPAAPVVTGLPGWAVSLHGVDAAGCAEVYKYWKTVKNADDATIQGNWDALLNHYAGHGTVGW
ncbi:MAG: hypothetical protein K6G83_00515 [Lachnospiraceae bacterium]|nr:hypothetical protein [Lachnospiraceae bacterium]